MVSYEKPLNRNHLKKLSILLGVDENELLTLGLANIVYDLVKNEEVALQAVIVAEKEIINEKNVLLK